MCNILLISITLENIFGPSDEFLICTYLRNSALLCNATDECLICTYLRNSALLCNATDEF